jgi:hypothetical protein
MSVKYFFIMCNIVRVGIKEFRKYIGKRLWPITGDGRREGKRAGDKNSETGDSARLPAQVAGRWGHIK